MLQPCRRRERGLLLPMKTALLCLLLAVPYADASGAEPKESVSAPAVACLDTLSGPRLDTTVAGFRLQVQGRFVQRYLPDFDIVVAEGGDRFLPLLRILRLLKTDFVCTDSSVAFQVEGAPRALVDFRAGTVSLGEETRPAPLKIGLSDVTLAAEIYLPEALMADILRMALEWKEEIYEYDLTSDRNLAIFDTESRRSPSPASVGMGWPLEFSGDLPTARVGRTGIPRVDFAELRLQTSQLRSRTDGSQSGWTTSPSMRIWGQALGGSMAGSISRRQTQTGGSEVGIDQASWTTWMDRSEGCVGDNSFGLSELAFPSLSILGARVNGLVGAGPKDPEQDPSMSGRRLTFLPNEEFQGFAPLGTKVTLSINDQEIETRMVEPAPDAPFGEGVYRFSGRDLLLNRLNEVKLVFQMPDGREEESRREVMGVNRLVPRGTFAYLGGIGTRSMTRTLQRETDGTFVGGRAHFGLTRRLTIGGYAARQIGFIQDGFQSQDGRLSLRIPPGESTHWGTQMMWMPLGRLFLDMAMGESSTPHRRPDRAFKGGADLCLGRFQLRPEGFWFGSRFEDGRDMGLSGRAGGRINLSYRSPAHQIYATGVQVRDNLDHSGALTTRIRLGQAGWSFRPWIPRTNMSLRMDLLSSPPVPDRRLLTITTSSSLVRHWTWQSQHHWGTPAAAEQAAQAGLREELEYRSRLLNGLSLGDVAALTTPTSEAGLHRSFASRWSLSLDYRHSSSYQRAVLDIGHQRWEIPSVQSSVGCGYDWVQNSPVLQERLELGLDRGRRNMVLFEHYTMKHAWSVRLLLQVNQILGFDGPRPYRLKDSGFDPSAGGIAGRVVLDTNGNGIADTGEPGLPDVEVISDTGRRATSGPNGQFLIPADGERRLMRVGLRVDELPAEYSPVVPALEARLRPGMVTQVDLTVAALGSISGRILSTSKDRQPVGVSRIQVLLLDDQGRVVGRSTTASDGSYYLGDVRGGVYKVSVDPKTIPPSLLLESSEVRVEVRSQERAADLGGVDFVGKTVNEPGVNAPVEGTPPPKQKETRLKVFGK